MKNLAELKELNDVYASVRSAVVKEAFEQIEKTGFKFRIEQEKDVDSYSCDEIRVFIDRENVMTKEDINAVCYIVKSLYSFVTNKFTMSFEDNKDIDFIVAVTYLCENKEEESEFIRNLDFFGIDLN